MNVLSPVTGKANTKLVEKFPSSKIMDLYRKNFKVDVSSYFTAISEVSVYECNDTKYRFYYPFSLEGKSDFYEQLSSSSDLYYPSWKWENEVASKFVKDGDRLLDVGCGDGIFLKEISLRKKVQGEGLELNPDALTKCLNKGINVHRKTVQAFLPDQEATFDVVTAFQVLEHIGDVKSFIESQVALLKPQGLLIIGVPYNDPYIYIKDKFDTLNLPPHHMGLWNERAFKNLESVFGIKLKTYKISELHDVLYYFSIQLNFQDRYQKLFWNNKVFRTGCRIVNKLLFPLKYFIKGHDIVVVFQKD